MSIKKPLTKEEYTNWMSQKLKIRNLSAYKLHYERVSERINQKFSNSEFWNELISNLRIYHSEYQLSEKQRLFSNVEFKPVLVIKDFSSFINKTHRKNVINNKNWPDPPQSGWITPENWYSRINDIVRTKIVVNYLEGMNYLSSKILEFCQERDVKYRLIPDARMDGYYAINSYFEDLEIPIIEQKTGQEKNIQISIELQITTQMQDLMRDLLHKEYEKTRIKNEADLQWVWKYQDDKFSTAYLAHLLHYAEGMIMQIIEKNRSMEE